MDPPQFDYYFKTGRMAFNEDNAATLWRPLSPTQTTFNIEGAKPETDLHLSLNEHSLCTLTIACLLFEADVCLTSIAGKVVDVGERIPTAIA